IACSFLKPAPAEIMPRVSASRQHFVIAAVALIALVLLAYAPALRGGFIWDDDHYVTENGNVRSAPGLANIWFRPQTSPQYYPLVFTSFWLENRLWDLRPVGYHLDNVLLHALAAIL